MGSQGLAVASAAGAAAHAELVASAADAPLWAHGLRHQIFLGDDAFVEQSLARANPFGLTAREVPRPQRSRTISLAQWLTTCATRGEAVRQAFIRSGMTMSAIAAAQGLSVARVSQLIAQAEWGFKSKT